MTKKTHSVTLSGRRVGGPGPGVAVVWSPCRVACALFVSLFLLSQGFLALLFLFVFSSCSPADFIRRGPRTSSFRAP